MNNEYFFLKQNENKPLIMNYSLFIIHYSLFIIHYSLFIIHYSMTKCN